MIYAVIVCILGGVRCNRMFFHYLENRPVKQNLNKNKEDKNRDSKNRSEMYVGKYIYIFNVYDKCKKKRKEREREREREGERALSMNVTSYRM